MLVVDVGGGGGRVLISLFAVVVGCVVGFVIRVRCLFLFFRVCC